MDTKFKASLDSKYSFEISRHASGPFKNLWKLVITTPAEPEPFEMVDADSLSTVVSKIGYVLERDGF